MSDQRFLQSGFEKQLAHLVEECGEVLAAAGKTQRWGPHSVNPLLPPAQQETNLRWLHREMADVREAIARLEATMEEEFGWPPEGKTNPPSEGRLSSINAREAQAEPERPEPLQWACHARGADEWELCASYEEALAMADKLNAGDDDGLIRAVPALWPYLAPSLTSPEKEDAQ